MRNIKSIKNTSENIQSLYLICNLFYYLKKVPNIYYHTSLEKNLNFTSLCFCSLGLREIDTHISTGYNILL